MSNSHWSQFSHTPKFFGLHPVTVVTTFAFAFIGQKWSIFWWFIVFMWVTLLVFKFWLKMPVNYTPSLLRTIMTGKNKTTKNYRDEFEL